MKVLITGASGAGNTALKHKLRSRAYAAIHVDVFSRQNQSIRHEAISVGRTLPTDTTAPKLLTYCD